MILYRNADVKGDFPNGSGSARGTWIPGLTTVLLATASYAASVVVDVGNMKVMTDPSSR